MEHTITDVDETMRKTAGEKSGQVYLGERFTGREVEIAVSAVDDDPVGWDDVLELIDDADPGEIPDDVLDSLVGTLASVNHDGRETTDSEWLDVATALTSTPADELPDQVVSAMNAKLTQLDMEARDD